jgi:DNA-binding MarR family transcriptional regulator
MSKLVIDKDFFSKQSKFLFAEFINNNEKYQTLAYFRRSPEAWLIMLKIMENYYADTDIHVEELINKIPNHIASRLSIFSLIDDADKKGFIIKVESNGDKRKKTIQPSEKFISEYNEWLSNFVTNSTIKL